MVQGKSEDDLKQPLYDRLLGKPPPSGVETLPWYRVFVPFSGTIDRVTFLLLLFSAYALMVILGRLYEWTGIEQHAWRTVDTTGHAEFGAALSAMIVGLPLTIIVGYVVFTVFSNRSSVSRGILLITAAVTFISPVFVAVFVSSHSFGIRAACVVAILGFPVSLLVIALCRFGESSNRAFIQARYSAMLLAVLLPLCAYGIQAVMAHALWQRGKAENNVFMLYDAAHMYSDADDFHFDTALAVAVLEEAIAIVNEEEDSGIAEAMLFNLYASRGDFDKAAVYMEAKVTKEKQFKKRRKDKAAARTDDGSEIDTGTPAEE